MRVEDNIDRLTIEMERYSNTLDQESATYWTFHHKRFKSITHLTGKLIGELERSSCNVERILRLI